MLTLALTLAASAAAPPLEVEVDPCLVTWTRSSGASVLSEQRGAGGPRWDDFPEAVAAGTPTPEHVAVAHTAAFVVDGRPVLYFSPDRATWIVDAAAFTDLAVADVVKLGAGKVANVGAVKPAARAALGDRGVAELLIQADLVRTWAHIGSTLCLVSESAADGAYRAAFTGTHTYFTSRKNEDPLAFELAIAPDGAIAITGR